MKKVWNMGFYGICLIAFPISMILSVLAYFLNKYVVLLWSVLSISTFYIVFTVKKNSVPLSNYILYKRCKRSANAAYVNNY